MAKIKKLDLQELGIRAGSVGADLAMKINELIDLYESKTPQDGQQTQEDDRVVIPEGTTVKFSPQGDS